MYLVLAALAIQPCVVLAQSQSGGSYYYYWLTPGRIVGIAIGGLALIFLFISLLLLARRRYLHRRPSRVAPSSSFTSGAMPVGAAARPPPAYPAWSGPPAVQQPIQTTTPISGPGSVSVFGPGAVQSSGLYYPSSYPSAVPPYGQPKPTGPSSSGPARSSTRPGRDLSAGSSRQGQGAPLDRPTPSVRTHEQGQEQGFVPLAPPPHRRRPSYATGAQSAGSGREESPPPYSPRGPPPAPDAPALTT